MPKEPGTDSENVPPNQPSSQSPSAPPFFLSIRSLHGVPVPVPVFFLQELSVSVERDPFPVYDFFSSVLVPEKSQSCPEPQKREKETDRQTERQDRMLTKVLDTHHSAAFEVGSIKLNWVQLVVAVDNGQICVRSTDGDAKLDHFRSE